MSYVFICSTWQPYFQHKYSPWSWGVGSTPQNSHEWERRDKGLIFQSKMLICFQTRGLYWTRKMKGVHSECYLSKLKEKLCSTTIKISRNIFQRYMPAYVFKIFHAELFMEGILYIKTILVIQNYFNCFLTMGYYVIEDYGWGGHLCVKWNIFFPSFNKIHQQLLLLQALFWMNTAVNKSNKNHGPQKFTGEIFLLGNPWYGFIMLVFV